MPDSIFTVLVSVPSWTGAKSESEARDQIDHMLNGCYPPGEVVYEVRNLFRPRRKSNHLENNLLVDYISMIYGSEDGFRQWSKKHPYPWKPTLPTT